MGCEVLSDWCTVLAFRDRAEDNTAMGIGLLFAVLATLSGLALTSGLRVHWSLAPFVGLAAMAVATSWCVRLGAPPILSSGVVVAMALLGAALAIREAVQIRKLPKLGDRVTVVVLSAAVIVPWALLGAALAGIDAPISTHDGAFHVELIDNLRHGVPVQGWYPMGFHSSVAAVLGLVPWVDTARGTVEATQALSMLAPFGVFALRLALGLKPRMASVGAVVMALTYIYPYDNQMWAGWPLATSILLLLGLWAVAARWITDPRPGLAVLAGLTAGAIVLTHGTEVYSSILGLLVIAVLRWRSIRFTKLAWQAPLAIAGAVVCALPYVSTLLGWAVSGGASAAGVASLDETSSRGQTVADSGADWLEFVLGVTGAASFVDLPVRAVLLFVGARQRQLRTALAAWLVFSGLLYVVSFVRVEPVQRLYVLTFPWLVNHRPPQMVVMFTSILVGAGLFVAVRWFWSLRSRLAAHPGAWRRLALVSGALLLFFAEGGAVTIYKTLQQDISEQNVYSADDRAAMSWLRQNAAPGEMVINDAAGDAGIWAPYKAGLPVLLPRSGSVPESRQEVAADLLTLDEHPSEAATACALHAGYVFVGSQRVDSDPVVVPGRAALEQATDLQEVFAS